MKKVIITFTLLFFLCVYGNDKIEVTLKQQAAIDVCNFLNLEECAVDIIYLTIDNYWHKGEYSKIFPLLYLITEICPQDVNAFALGGWFLINGIASKYNENKKGEIEKFAIEFMKKGIEKNPHSYTLYWELAWFYFNKNELYTSLEYLEKAEKYPHCFWVENLKAHIYMKLMNYEKAIEEWEKIKEKYPDKKDIAEKFLERLKKKNE